MTLTQINKAGLDEIALDHVFTIGASGSSAYTFQGEGLNGTVNNPTLYLTRGKTYRFENGSGGHPIRIQSTSGASGTAYNTGVTNNAGSGTVIVEVQHNAPDVLYYQCTSHAAMNGILYITGALADGGVTTAKIADDAVTAAKIADNAVVDSAIQNGAVTAAKIANNNVGSQHIANGEVGTTELADQAVTLAKLEHGTSSNNGKFLRANNGADPTFETVSTDLVGDTSPQLGGDLDSNGNNIKITDGEQLRLGDGNDFTLEHNGSISKLLNESSRLIISGSASDNVDIMKTQSEYMAKFIPDGAVELYHDNEKKLNTTAGGVVVTGDFQTTGSGGTISANEHLKIPNDTGRIYLGSSNDLQVYHDGSNSKIVNSSGRLHLENSGGLIRTNTNHGFFVQAADGNTTYAEIDNEGLKFNGDTSGDNALDDYEVGTFTPTIQDAASGGNSHANSGVRQGKYVKIGSAVTVSINCRSLTNTNFNGSHQLFITNLPFRQSGVEKAVAWTQVQYFNNVSSTEFGMHFQINNNETIMRFFKMKDNQGANPTITFNHWMYSIGYYGFATTFTYITDQ